MRSVERGLLLVLSTVVMLVMFSVVSRAFLDEMTSLTDLTSEVPASQVVPTGEGADGLSLGR